MLKKKPKLPKLLFHQVMTGKSGVLMEKNENNVLTNVFLQDCSHQRQLQSIGKLYWSMDHCLLRFQRNL